MARILNGKDVDPKDLREDLKQIINSEDFYGIASVSDYLRSKGYAVPFMGLSVETLIEYGWVRLR